MERVGEVGRIRGCRDGHARLPRIFIGLVASIMTQNGQSQSAVGFVVVGGGSASWKERDGCCSSGPGWGHGSGEAWGRVDCA